jgi:serine/threonine-protein kinase
VPVASAAIAGSPPAAALAAPVAVPLTAATDATSTSVASKAEAARHRKSASATDGAPIPAAPSSEGVVQLAISPWGQVEVDGKPMGTSPPLSRLTLSSGQHTVTVLNSDFPAYTQTVTVDGDSSITLRHHFGP